MKCPICNLSLCNCGVVSENKRTITSIRPAIGVEQENVRDTKNFGADLLQCTVAGAMGIWGTAKFALMGLAVGTIFGVVLAGFAAYAAHLVIKENRIKGVSMNGRR